MTSPTSRAIERRLRFMPRSTAFSSAFSSRRARRRLTFTFVPSLALASERSARPSIACSWCIVADPPSASGPLSPTFSLSAPTRHSAASSPLGCIRHSLPGSGTVVDVVGSSCSTVVVVDDATGAVVVGADVATVVGVTPVVVVTASGVVVLVLVVAVLEVVVVLVVDVCGGSDVVVGGGGTVVVVVGDGAVLVVVGSSVVGVLEV